MNAHFTTTEPDISAKVSASIVDLKLTDASKLQVGELVYAQPTKANPLPKIEGIASVVQLRGNQFASHKTLVDETDDLIWQDVETITHHLPGYELYKGKVSSGFRDEKLIQIGHWIADLIPVERELWAKCEEMRARLDAVSADAYVGDVEYNSMVERHSADAGCALAILSFAAMHSHAKTPAGHAARLAAVEHDLNIGFDMSDDYVRELAEEAQRVADYVQPRVTVGRTLAELIEAHRRAEAVYLASSEALEPLEKAWDDYVAKNIPTTPGRIKNGRVVCALSVTGVPADLEEIDREHQRWTLEFSLGAVKEIAPAAAKELKGQIEASRLECRRIYEQETLPALQVARGALTAAQEAHNTAYEAEIEAIEALNRYRPTTLDEVAGLTRYLVSTDYYTSRSTAEFAATLMQTLTTVGNNA